MQFFLVFIFGVSFLLGLSRIFPYFEGNIPLGYDPGIFRSYFLSYFELLPNIQFNAHDIWIQQIYEPGLGLLTNILLLIGYDVDFLISFGLVFFSMLVGIYLFIFLKKYGNISAVLGISFYFISIVQYKAFWWNYYKQIIGILFLFVSYYLLERKKYILLFPILCMMFLINRASGVFFLLSFILYKFLEYFQTKKITFFDVLGVLFAGGVAFLCYFPVAEHQIFSLIQPLVTTLGAVSSGTFFSSEEFGMRSILFLIGSFGGLSILIQRFFNKENLSLFTLSSFIIGVVWTSLGLFFYNRFYIFFDIFLIILTALFFQEIIQKYKKIGLSLLTIFFLLQSYFYIDYVKKNSYPLIDQIEFDKIKEIPNLIPKDSSIMVTHKNYSPWLIGYTNMPVIAPGLFDWNRWDLETWKKWWNGDGAKKCELLQEYSDISDLYLWIGKRQPHENLENAYCMETIFSGDNFIFLRINTHVIK